MNAPVLIIRPIRIFMINRIFFNVNVNVCLIPHHKRAGGLLEGYFSMSVSIYLTQNT